MIMETRSSSSPEGFRPKTWIKWDAIAWKRLTETLTVEEEIVLMRMMVELVERDGPFPRDLDLASRLLRIGGRQKTGRVLKALEGKGLLALDEDGYMFEFARQALDNRRNYIASQRQKALKKRGEPIRNEGEIGPENNGGAEAAAEAESSSSPDQKKDTGDFTNTIPEAYQRRLVDIAGENKARQLIAEYTNSPMSRGARVAGPAFEGWLAKVHGIGLGISAKASVSLGDLAHSIANRPPRPSATGNDWKTGPNGAYAGRRRRS